MLGTKILEESESKYNGRVIVKKSWGMGIYIQAQGLTQSGGIVTSIWKSTLKKINSKKIKNILILGLGGGSVANLSFKKWPDSSIIGVDIDSIIVNLGKKYLDQPNIKTTISDALVFLNKNQKEKFDLVIVDLYQGDNYPSKFETINFLKKLKSKLSASGVVVFNRLFYKEKKELALNFGEILKKEFQKVEYYYPQANIMFICSNNN